MKPTHLYDVENPLAPVRPVHIRAVSGLCHELTVLEGSQPTMQVELRILEGWWRQVVLLDTGEVIGRVVPVPDESITRPIPFPTPKISRVVVLYPDAN